MPPQATCSSASASCAPAWKRRASRSRWGASSIRNGTRARHCRKIFFAHGSWRGSKASCSRRRKPRRSPGWGSSASSSATYSSGRATGSSVDRARRRAISSPITPARSPCWSSPPSVRWRHGSECRPRFVVMGDMVASDEPRRLADFLREHREEIIAHCEQEVRKVRAASQLARPVLIDHLPEFIEELADYVGELRTGHEVAAPEEHPQIHALERLEVGYNLEEVVAEYAIL